MSDRVINIREFPVHKMKFPFKLIAIGKSGSGKSVALKSIINQFKDKIPVACVASQQLL
jgi:ABC-type dipeptide/oligopeptide/nickel transport system ATPase component